MIQVRIQMIQDMIQIIQVRIQMIQVMIDDLGQDLYDLGCDLDDLAQNLDDLGYDLDGLGQDLDYLGEDLHNLGWDPDHLGEDLDHLDWHLHNLGQDILQQIIQARIYHLGQDLDHLGQDLDNLGWPPDNLDRDLSDLCNSLFTSSISEAQAALPVSSAALNATLNVTGSGVSPRDSIRSNSCKNKRREQQKQRGRLLLVGMSTDRTAVRTRRGSMLFLLQTVSQIVGQIIAAHLMIQILPGRYVPHLYDLYDLAQCRRVGAVQSA